MKGLYFLLAIAAIATADITLVFKPEVELDLTTPSSPKIRVTGVHALDNFEIEHCDDPDFDGVEGNNNARMATFNSFGDFLKCFKKDEGKRSQKRGFSLKASDDSIDDHEVWKSLLTISSADGTLSMEKPLELWFPTELLVDHDLSVTDNELDVVSALTSLKFEQDDSQEWTVEIEFDIQAPYGPEGGNDNNLFTPTVETTFLGASRVATFQQITKESDTKYKFTFTVSGCESWNAVGPITIPTECLANNAPCVESDPEDITINVNIQTATACAVTQVYNFGQTIAFHSLETSTDAHTSGNLVEADDIVTIDQFIYIDLEIETFPAGITPTFVLTRVCAQETGATGHCDSANNVDPTKITPKEDGSGDVVIKAVDLLAAYLVGKDDRHGATFNVVAEYEVTYVEPTPIPDGERRKRSIEVRRAARGITIEQVKLHSGASALNIVPLLLAAVAVFLA